MIVGAWFHPSGLEKIEDSGFKKARAAGFLSARTYNYEHSEKIAGELKKHSMSLYAGVGVRTGTLFDASGLVKDWRSQLRPEPRKKLLHRTAAYRRTSEKGQFLCRTISRLCDQILR